MCKICEELEKKFRDNVERSGTADEREGDICERELVWREWKKQEGECAKTASQRKV
jgi:hypothetical protein